MGKVKFERVDDKRIPACIQYYEKVADKWFCKDSTDFSGDYYPASDYEALQDEIGNMDSMYQDRLLGMEAKVYKAEAKLAALVEESKITLYYLYNSFEPDNQSKQYDRFKAAIAAADAAKEG